MIKKYSKLRTKKWLTIIIIAVVCIGLILWGGAAKNNKLTIEKVKQLLKKGDKLSWEDFQPYNGTEIGSGLYIKMYPIDDNYSLQVGSGGPKEPPMYIYLVNTSNQTHIDIRYDDIDTFITNVP